MSGKLCKICEQKRIMNSKEPPYCMGCEKTEAAAILERLDEKIKEFEENAKDYKGELWSPNAVLAVLKSVKHGQLVIMPDLESGVK